MFKTGSESKLQISWVLELLDMIANHEKYGLNLIANRFIQCNALIKHFSPTIENGRVVVLAFRVLYAIDGANTAYYVLLRNRYICYTH